MSNTALAQKASVNPAAAYLAGLPSDAGREKGIASRLRSIAKLMGSVDEDGNGDYLAVNWMTLDAANMAAILSKLKEAGYAPATIELSRAALRGVARKMYEMRLIDEHRLNTINAVKAPAGSRLPAGRDLTVFDKTALMDAASALLSPRRERERALLAVFMSVGPRIHEVANAALEDINLSTGEWRIIGKGNKERMPPLNTQAVRILRQWLDVRTYQPGPLFCAISKSGTIRLDGQLSTVAIHKAIKHVASLAGITLSSHDFRRTVVGDFEDANVPASVGMAITGHSKSETYYSYSRRKGKRMREAVEVVQIPA